MLFALIVFIVFLFFVVYRHWYYLSRKKAILIFVTIIATSWGAGITSSIIMTEYREAKAPMGRLLDKIRSKNDFDYSDLDYEERNAYKKLVVDSDFQNSVKKERLNKLFEIDNEDIKEDRMVFPEYLEGEGDD